MVGSWVSQRPVDDVLSLLGSEGADVPCARVSSPEELIDHPQLQAREMIERHPHPAISEVLFHGNPLKLSGADPRAIALALPRRCLGWRKHWYDVQLALDFAIARQGSIHPYG